MFGGEIFLSETNDGELVIEGTINYHHIRTNVPIQRHAFRGYALCEGTLAVKETDSQIVSVHSDCLALSLGQNCHSPFQGNLIPDELQHSG